MSDNVMSCFVLESGEHMHATVGCRTSRARRVRMSMTTRHASKVLCGRPGKLFSCKKASLCGGNIRHIAFTELPHIFTARSCGGQYDVVVTKIT